MMSSGTTPKRGKKPDLFTVTVLLLGLVSVVIYLYNTTPTGMVNIHEDDTILTDTVKTSDKININTATKAELMILDGIGEVKATAIITHREKYGAFTEIDEIKEVEGISTNLYEEIADDITI